MKKVLFSIAAVIAMMTSCKKSSQDVDPGPDTDSQKVVLGTKVSGLTRASVNNMTDWLAEIAAGNYVYVFSVNDSTSVAAERIFIDNEAATCTAETSTTGSLSFPGKTFYYGTSEKDIYSFYAFYLGYARTSEKAVRYSKDSIIVEGVKINGDNDIMTAVTDKYEDAHVGDTTMVNPKIVYSSRSSRLGVIPNLRFAHSLSKFVFEMKVAHDSLKNIIKVDSITLDSPVTGSLTLLGKKQGFVPSGAKQNVKLKMTGSEPLDTTYKNIGESLMLSPADTGSYTLYVYYTQQIGGSSKRGSMKKVIKPSDVKVESTTATSFDAGKQYKLYIIIYGLESVKVKVMLTPWEEAGSVIVDPDSGEGKIEGKVIRGVKEGKAYFLKMKEIAVGQDVTDVITETPAADGAYRLSKTDIVPYDTLNVFGGKVNALK